VTRLHEVREFDLPLTVDHAAVVAHARRVAHISRAFPTVQPARADRYVYRTPYGHIVSFALALALAVDLRLDPRDGRRLPPGRLKAGPVVQAVWPAATDATPMRDVVALDRPQYQADEGGRCPIPGSRGGKCNERGRRRTRWVTNSETGDWEWRDVCDLHRPRAAAVQASCPEPPPNRGGFLDLVFPDLDTDAVYAWAHPGWTRTPGRVVDPPPVGVRPTLRLVLGDAP
jgi:hypothetical protein